MPAPLLITFLSFVSAALVYPVLPFQAMALGADALFVTLLLVAEPLVGALLAPFVGRWSDRYGRRGVAVALLALAIPAYLVMSIADQLWILFLSRLLAGASVSVSPVIQAYLADITSKQDRILGMAGVNAAFCLAWVVGPVIAFFGLGASGTDYPSVAVLAMLGGVLATTVAIVTLPASTDWLRRTAPETTASPTPAAARHLPFSAFGQAAGATLVAAILLFSLTYAAMDTTLGLWLDQQLALGARALSVAFAIAGLAAFLALLLIKRLVDPLSEEAVACGSGLAMVAGYGLLLLSPSLWTLVLAMILLGAGMAVGTSCLQSLISQAAPPGRQGAVMGDCDAAINWVQIAGPLGAGMAIDRLGLFVPYLACALLTGLATVLLARHARALSSHNLRGSLPEGG